MAHTSYVRIYHGLIDSFSSRIHKPQKVTGLADRLRKVGYRVDLVPSEYLNYCMIEMCGHEVFRCNLKYLSFNTDMERDVVCQRAFDAVLCASAMFQRTRTYMWTCSELEREVFKRTEYAPKAYFPKRVDLPPVTVTCCNTKQCYARKILSGMDVEMPKTTSIVKYAPKDSEIKSRSFLRILDHQKHAKIGYTRERSAEPK